jgi:hypothetical protein
LCVIEATLTPLAERSAWLTVLRRFMVAIGCANLIWEFAHLPLYTLWYEASSGDIVFAAIHCTGGDLLIAGASLLLALLLAGPPAWPRDGYRRIAMLTMLFALSYTALSEWINTKIRGSWAYAEAMPVIPLIDAGLSPMAQWLVIPVAAFWWAQVPLSAQRRMERCS